MQSFDEILNGNFWIKRLYENGLLREVKEQISTELEIAHASYIEVKRERSQALLFTNVRNAQGKQMPPVLSNIFGSSSALNLILGREPDEIAAEIESLLKPKRPQNFSEKLDFLTHLISLRKIFVKRLSGRGECQQVAHLGADIDLGELPVLKTWEGDGGAFITMGQVYTKDLNSQTQNLGMYRLQIYGRDRLGMHWQIHKDGAGFFDEYRKAGRKMPVSVAIGGDPLYIWCAQAPLPKGIFELLLYGFIRRSPARLVKSLTNEIYVPEGADYVIEGFVDPAVSEPEGPFGDHTGYYTPVEPFPVMEVSAITHKRAPVFHATVVGKPPLEDKFMGYATERIFLPLFRTSAPDLIDYKMPENGVFHNLILAKIAVRYPAAAKQIMHAFWGVGQMSFVKHAVFVPQDAPSLDEYEALTKYVLNRIGARSLVFSEGVCDQLDHASPNSCFGGKLGIDATADLSSQAPQILSDEELLAKFQSEESAILALKQHFCDTKNPLVLINIDKKELVERSWRRLLKFSEYFKILIFTDAGNDASNLYMSVWRIVNSIDALRDVFVAQDDRICIDATSKHEWEGYTRRWPQETLCNREVVASLIERGIVQDEPELFKKFEIF